MEIKVPSLLLSIFRMGNFLAHFIHTLSLPIIKLMSTYIKISKSL
uniref:Uncharacterized protein n=1 Tax=Rhizophora mucronata TaxID=61149 RepID=A0A2P2N3N1_RHIMU